MDSLLSNLPISVEFVEVLLGNPTVAAWLPNQQFALLCGFTEPLLRHAVGYRARVKDLTRENGILTHRQVWLLMQWRRMSTPLSESVVNPSLAVSDVGSW
jgi:hypothetical protein